MTYINSNNTNVACDLNTFRCRLVFWPMVIRLQQRKRPRLHEEERTCMMLLV